MPTLTRTQRAEAAAAALRGDDPFLRGFALALAEVQRLSGCDSNTRAAARNAGVTMAELAAAGVDEYDLATLREAGVP